METKKQAIEDLKTKNLSSFNDHQTHSTAELFKESGWEKETDINRTRLEAMQTAELEVWKQQKEKE